MRAMLVIFAVTFMSGCTSVRVSPVRSGLNMGEVCVEENKEVTVDGFLSIVREGFERHGISTRIIDNSGVEKCEYLLTYTAENSWDFASYLSYAELKLENNEKTVGYAKYHMHIRGWVNFIKWKSTKGKIDPVIDELLSNVKI